jgi:hypothetical protein
MTEARGGGSRRRRVTFHELIQLANFMTDRDREIAIFLYRHQVLTTEQLELLFFPSRRSAQKRLLKLLEHVVVERFYPPIPYGQGKQQAHWVLGHAGVKLVAACLEVEPKVLGLQRRDDWGAHPQLVHRLEVNTFVTELVRATLQDPAMGVTGWRGQTGAGRRLELPNGRRIVAPDAGFDLVFASSVIECYLEWDRGTETAWRVADKVRRYGLLFQKMHYLDRWPINLLFVVPSERRLRAVQDEVQKRVSNQPHRFAELFMEWPTSLRRPNSGATVPSRRSGETSPTGPSRGPCQSSCRDPSSRLGWTGHSGAAGATADSLSRAARRCGTTSKAGRCTRHGRWRIPTTCPPGAGRQLDIARGWRSHGRPAESTTRRR